MGRVPWTVGASIRGGFDRRGVDFSPIKDAGAFMRYVADHASKRKQEQMGWQGRQWGVIGRKWLIRRKGKDLGVSERERFIILRVLRRLRRYKLRVPCVFGSKLSRKGSGVGVVYLDARTQERIQHYAEGAVLDTVGPTRLVAAELMGQSVGLLP